MLDRTSRYDESTSFMKKQKKPFLSPFRILMLIIFVLVIISLATFLLMNGKNVAVLNPQGIVAEKERDLLLFTTALGMVVIIPVFTMLFVFAWRYREGNTKATYRPNEDRNIWYESLWWGIPIIIIAILSVVTWISTHDLDPYKKLDSTKEPITIRVVALQWKWLFIYPDQKIATVNEVRFPEKTPINFELTADAPMNAFWIPNLGSQIYAMNGMTSKLSLEANEQDEYPGVSSNISGKGFSHMSFKAISTSEREFDVWARNIEGSDNHLDWNMYENKLSKPTEGYPVTYFMLHDPALYDKIVMKYMDHTGDDEKREAMSEMNDEHTHMNHEGMHH